MGQLIIIEGGDGSGKATQTAKLLERLKAEGYPVRSVSFPNYDSPAVLSPRLATLLRRRWHHYCRSVYYIEYGASND